MQRARSSQVEGELVEVHIAGDGANFRSEASDLVCEHAGGRNLDRIIPVVVVVTQGVREVKDGHLADIRRVLGDVEVCRLDGTLGDGVRHEEEVELAIDDLGLLDEARVDVGTLRWVVDEVLLFSMRPNGQACRVHAQKHRGAQVKQPLLVVSTYGLSALDRASAPAIQHQVLSASTFQ